MEDQFKKGLSSWIDFMELRYKTEKSIIDVFDNNEIELGNSALNSMIENGVKFSRAFMETRYKLERELIGSISNVDIKRGEAESGGVTIKKDDEKKGPIHSGTIRIQASQSETVELPVQLQNDFDDTQNIQVHASSIINVETAKPVSSQFEIEKKSFEIPPNSAGSASIKLALNGRVFKPGKDYAARIEVHGFEQKALDVFISVLDKGKDTKIAFEQPS